MTAEVSESVRNCVTHHGCDCREWAYEQVLRYGGLLATLRDAEAKDLTIHVATRPTCAEHISAGDHIVSGP